MLDLAEAKRRQACLKTRLDQMRDDIFAVHQIISRNIESLLEKDRFQVPASHAKPARYIKWPTEKEIVDLLTEIKEIKNLISDLERRRNELGVGV